MRFLIASDQSSAVNMLPKVMLSSGIDEISGFGCLAPFLQSLWGVLPQTFWNMGLLGDLW